MKTLFERLGDVFNPNTEKSGIELLEELAASHCKECGCDLSDHRSTMNEEYCIDCYNEMHRQDIAFESQREK